MKVLLMATALALIFLPAETALAKKNKGKSGGKHTVSAMQRCPPGLAKKNNGCRPPGQVKKQNKQRTTSDEGMQRSHERQRPNHAIRSEAEATNAGSIGAKNVSPRSTGSAGSTDFVDLVSGERLRVGSRFDTAYRARFRVIDNPSLFGLAPIDGNRSYFRIGDTAVLVDDDTRAVISLIVLKGVLIR